MRLFIQLMIIKGEFVSVLHRYIHVTAQTDSKQNQDFTPKYKKYTEDTYLECCNLNVITSIGLILSTYHLQCAFSSLSSIRLSLRCISSFDFVVLNLKEKNSKGVC